MWLQEKISFLPKEKIFSTIYVWTNIPILQTESQKVEALTLDQSIVGFSNSANGQRLGGWWIGELLLCLKRKTNGARELPLRQCLASLITFWSRQRPACSLFWSDTPWPPHYNHLDLPIIIITVLTKVWKFPQPAHNISESEIRPDVQTVWSPLIGNC